MDNTELIQEPSFDDVVPVGSVLEALKKLGFAGPTAVQAATIPAALTGKDLIVQARTGSGKTFAFVVPMLIKLQRAIEAGQVQQGTFGMIVTPTRELASQILSVIASITTEVKPACLIGGASIGGQIRDLEEDSRIIVGTPGRILDLMRQRHVMLRKCQMFVLDEADEMLSMGFIDDVRAILSRLPSKRQGLFVSATITDRVNVLAGSFLTKPETIVVNRAGEELPPIEHVYYEVESSVTAKASLLCDLIEIMRPRSAMIFCNTKSDTETVEIFLRRRGFDARRINSDLTQKERDYIMGRIKAQELRFLVGTDIASRGIDIEEMDLVINYALPDLPETYMHRTGRTGRAGRAGTALSLVGPQDFMPFTALKRFINFELKKLEPPTEEELGQARLTHFYQIIREAGLELNGKDLAMAQKLLAELGGITEPTEELTETVAKLCRFTFEHFMRTETITLEDEMRKHRETQEPQPQQHRQGRERSGGGGRGGPRRERGRSQGRGRRYD